MSSNAEGATYIRIFHKEEDGWADDGITYTAADFGGIVPAVGDLIVDPGVLEGRNRRQAENRDIYQVLHRYFQPTIPGRDPRIVLCVQGRAGKALEIDLLGD